jgi:hypothetical protein
LSRINGEKARAAIARKRRTQQRMKDRAARALTPVASGTTSSSKAVAKKPKAAKPLPETAAESQSPAKPRARKAAATDSTTASPRSRKAKEE